MKKDIRKSNLDNQILEAIKDAVLDGEWQEGDRLPSETQLAEMFQTSRPTVRMAIQKLNTMGLLETKVGSGTYVKKRDFAEYLDNVSDLITTPEMMNDVADFRKAIETACIYLVIQKATDEELRDLERQCDEYTKAMDINRIGENAYQSYLAEMDYKIHYRLCELSQNSLFTLAYAAAQGTLKKYFFANLKARFNLYRQQNDIQGFINSPQAHKRLVEALIRRDETLSIAIAKNIIDYKIIL